MTAAYQNQRERTQMTDIISGGVISAAIITGVILLGLVAIGLIIARLYTRASQDSAFVRTGFGGAKVIVEGGALVIPILHEVTKVELRTQKLDVSRKQKEALITKDSLRADVSVEFFVRVKKEAESIKVAAQTLGDLTEDSYQLRTLIEGKFVDALRAVAATMDLNELHQNRTDFVQKVRQAANEDLEKNGLELESASLVGLDQTDQQFFNPDNTFDAQGLKKIQEITEAKRKERNDIVQGTEVDISRRNYEAKVEQLEIDRQEEEARLGQEKDIETRRARQAAEIAGEQARSKKDSETARITSDREIEEADIEKRKAVDIAGQLSQIAIEEQSKARSAAEAEASEERAKAIEAEERVKTAQQIEIAERDKKTAVIEAEKEAETKAVGIKVQAQAEKEAAQARADAITTAAQAEADAEKTVADAKAATYAVDAEGQRALNEAQNTLSTEIVRMNVQLEVVRQLPNIIAQSVKPMENIDTIRVMDVNGLGNNAGGAGANANGNSGVGLADQIVNSALRHRSQAPLIDALLQEVGIKGGGDLNSLVSSAADQIAPEAVNSTEDLNVEVAVTETTEAEADETTSA